MILQIGQLTLFQTKDLWKDFPTANWSTKSITRNQEATTKSATSLHSLYSFQEQDAIAERRTGEEEILTSLV